MDRYTASELLSELSLRVAPPVALTISITEDTAEMLALRGQVSELTKSLSRAKRFERKYRDLVAAVSLLLPSPAESEEEPEAEPVAEPAAEPVAEPEAEPVAEPAAEPVAEPAAEPVAEPEAEPVAEPVAKPVAERWGDEALDLDESGEPEPPTPIPIQSNVTGMLSLFESTVAHEFNPFAPEYKPRSPEDKLKPRAPSSDEEGWTKAPARRRARGGRRTVVTNATNADNTTNTTAAQRKRMKNQCWNCGSTSHRKDDCPQKRIAPQA